jgi:hypothetical protein
MTAIDDVLRGAAFGRTLIRKATVDAAFKELDELRERAARILICDAHGARMEPACDACHENSRSAARDLRSVIQECHTMLLRARDSILAAWTLNGLEVPGKGRTRELIGDIDTTCGTWIGTDEAEVKSEDGGHDDETTETKAET